MIDQVILTEDKRREMFAALVHAQDQKIDVPRSRKLMAERFGVTENQVKIIEREGLNSNWPPLEKEWH